MGRFVLAAIILNGAWTQLDVMQWWALAVPLLVLLLDAFPLRATGRTIVPPSRPEALIPIAAAALICGVHLLHVALTAREEFGFGGDEGYHLSATRAFALYFLKAGPFLIGAAAVYVACRRWWPRIAAAATSITLIVASLWLANDPLFGRYPTAFYLLSMPLNVAMDVARIPYPFTANHIVNMLSLPAWLFLLRPLIIGRWPDWRVLPAALLIYFQGPSIVYVSGGLLEPWAFVFILLACEAAAAFEDDRRWLAVILAGIATLFKETAILFLPPLWLLTMVAWRGWRPSLRDDAINVGVAAVAPFVIYYMVRRGLNIFRGYEMAGAASLWTAARVSDLVAASRFQLGAGGSISVAIVAVWAALGFAGNRAAFRQHAIWTLTALALIVFFAADVASIPYTGYGRFLAYPLLALCGVTFVTTHWLERGHRTALIAVSIVMAALQIVPAWRVLALDFKADYERNSLEWPSTLVRYPIRTLSNRLGGLQDGSTISTIRVIAFGTDMISLRVAYPDLASRYDIQGDKQSASAPNCECRNAREAIIAVFEWPANFSAAPDARERFDRNQSACVAQVRATCGSIAVESAEDAAIIGVLGAGPRAPAAPVAEVATPRFDRSR